jgi:hypothetical protein
MRETEHDSDFGPLSRKERREALTLAAKAMDGGLPLLTRERSRLGRLLLKYENALQSVGYLGDDPDA